MGGLRETHTSRSVLLASVEASDAVLGMPQRGDHFLSRSMDASLARALVRCNLQLRAASVPRTSWVLGVAAVNDPRDITSHPTLTYDCGVENKNGIDDGTPKPCRASLYSTASEERRMRLSFLAWSSLISEIGNILRRLFEEAERLLLCRRLAGCTCLYDAMSRRSCPCRNGGYFEFKLRTPRPTEGATKVTISLTFYSSWWWP